jgi:pimeloyl-ACP methyl ester carboxylesterase
VKLDDLKAQDAVVLMHGISHTRWTMAPLERALHTAGYATFNLSYPSRRYGISDLANWLASKMTAKCLWSRYAQVHFVGHSMGGLVIDTYLRRYRPEFPAKSMGRVVMMGTPHGGSEVADSLHRSWPYGVVFGPAGQELTTAARRRARNSPFYELGMIAGTQGWLYPLGQLCLQPPHDGCVSVESTHIEGMKDHLTLPVHHGLMPWNKAVHAQTLHFLKDGAFKR